MSWLCKLTLEQLEFELSFSLVVKNKQLTQWPPLEEFNQKAFKKSHIHRVELIASELVDRYLLGEQDCKNNK